MKTVSSGSQYYDRLLAKLNEQESSIESLQKERITLSVSRDAARKELEELSRRLDRRRQRRQQVRRGSPCRP